MTADVAGHGVDAGGVLFAMRFRARKDVAMPSRASAPGLAAADEIRKGVGVGVVAIVVANRERRSRMQRDSVRGARGRAIALDSKLAIEPLMWPVRRGFVLANRRDSSTIVTFKDDFLYNYMTAPVVCTKDQDWAKLWETLFCVSSDLIGAPEFGRSASGRRDFGLDRGARGRPPRPTRRLVKIEGVRALLRHIRAFPSLETSFVLPIVPFWMMFVGAVLARMARTTTLAAWPARSSRTNVVCSAWVGSAVPRRSRSAAALWVREHGRRDRIVEYDLY